MKDCFGRRETFKIDTRVLRTNLSVPVVFKAGDFVFDFARDTGREVGGAAWSMSSQKWLLEISSFPDIALYRRFERDASRGIVYLGDILRHERIRVPCGDSYTMFP